MADTKRPVSKATVSSVATKSTKFTLKSAVTSSTQKSGVSKTTLRTGVTSTSTSQKSGLATSSHRSAATVTTPKSTVTHTSQKSAVTSTTQNSSNANNSQKTSQKKRVQKVEDKGEAKHNNPVSMGNNIVFDEILKVQKNKLQVMEITDFFDDLKNPDIEIEVKDELVILKGKTQEIVDEYRYKIDKKCKDIVTRLDNIGNLKAKFLQKEEVSNYINFMLQQDRVLCSWQVNTKVHDLLVFASSQDVAVEGSKLIKNCIQSIEIEKEQLEFIELQEFFKDNEKVWAVHRKKKGDVVLMMTNDQYVLYQRLFNHKSENDEVQNQVMQVYLSPWKLEYFKMFADSKLRALCNLYKVHYTFFNDHIELHGGDPEIVNIDIDRMADEIFISLEHSFGNAPKLTKAIEEKRDSLEKQKQCMINITNKAYPHSGWLGNRRDVKMHIINLIGPVETCDCDVLICPVTRNLEAFGIVKDILNLGGKPVHADINKILKNSEESGTPIEPEEIVVLQNTGNLKCQLLLLTVIPPWTRKNDVSLSLIYNCARRIINIISDTGYRSLGMPLDIADDFPSHMYSTILMNNFWKMRKQFEHFMHVYGYADSQSTIEDIDGFLLSEVIVLGHWSRIVFDKPKHYSEKQTSEITVNIVEDSIVDMDDKVDVIVNATNHNDLEYSVMSKDLIRKAGRENIVQEYLQLYPDGVGVCDVAVTQGGKLNCCHIFHGCLYGWILNGNLSIKMLKLFMNRCLAEAERRQCTSIAFPALGSSLLIFPPVLVAKVMFKAVEKFGETEKPQHLKTVNFVLNPLEESVAEVFRNVQDWMVSRNNQLTTFDLPPKHIKCIHKKHGIRFIITAIDRYKDMRYKEVKVNIAFVNKEEQEEIVKPAWDMTCGSYTVMVKVTRTEKALTEGMNKMVEVLEKHRFHVIDMVLLNGRDSGIIKDGRPSSFGPWTEPENAPKSSSGMTLRKQIDLIMSTVVQSTEKIYQRDRKSETADPNLSYIRVVRLLATTVDFKDMLKQLKKGGIEKGNGEMSSWHICEKKPQKYKYHIQVVGKRDDAELVLDILKTDVAQMEEAKRVHFKISPPVKRAKRKIDVLFKAGYHITLDEAGKRAILEGTSKEVIEIRKELEEFLDNTLNVNLSEDDYTALIHLAKKEKWFHEILSYVYDKGTLVLTHKKDSDPDFLLSNVKNKMEEIRKMSETDVPLQKKMTLFLEEMEKAMSRDIQGVYCFLSFNKKRIIVKGLNIRKATEGKYAILEKLGMVAQVKKKKSSNASKSSSQGKEEVKNGFLFTSKEGITIVTYPGDFQKLKVDCLVIPTNKNLKPAKGIGQDIAQVAGGQVEKECDGLITEKGDLQIRTCCSTNAGSLSYHCLIHTVSPYWNSYKDQKKKCLEDLRAAVLSALHLANSHGHKTVAFTSVGTGAFGVPKPFCAIQYYKAVEEYGKHMDKGDNSIEEIHFVDPEEEMFQLLHKTFSKYLGEGIPV